MSQWDDRISKHAVTASLEKLQSAVQQVEELEDLDEKTLADVARLRTATDFIASRLGAADPALAPMPILNGLKNNIEQAAVQLEAFVGSGDGNQMTQVQNSIDGALNHVTSIPIAVVPADFDAVRESATSVRRTAGQLISNLRKEAADARKQAQDLAARLGEVRNEVTQQKGRLDQAISSFQTTSNEAEKGRASASVQEEKKRSSAFSDFEDKIAAEWGQRKAQLDDLLADAQKVAGAIAETGMAAGYQKSANKARNSRRLWQIAAVISLLGFVGFAVLASFEVIWHATGAAKEFSWHFLGARAFAAAAWGVLAAYCGKQADRQGRRERYYRQMELEIASIGPFIARLPEELRNQLIQSMTDRFFGQRQLEEAEAASIQIPGFFELLKLVFVDRIQK